MGICRMMEHKSESVHHCVDVESLERGWVTLANGVKIAPNYLLTHGRQLQGNRSPKHEERKFARQREVQCPRVLESQPHILNLAWVRNRSDG